MLATLSTAYKAAVLDVLEVLDVLGVVVEVEVPELLDELPGLRASVL